MEYVWSIFEGRTALKLRRFPHRQGIHEELMEVWELWD
jgi:hypothetical protein